jgi:hypothetical protein
MIAVHAIFGAKAKEFQRGILMLRWKEKKIGG